MVSAPLWIVWTLGAFAIGSIPFGIIIGRAHGIDIRLQGSKNIGATNVGRVLGRKWGFVCFVLDALKGALPVLLVIRIAANEPTANSAVVAWLVPLVAAGAIFGHLYSPWAGFKGGKGVATSFGALVAMWPTMTFAALAALAVWLVFVKVFRFVSLASMCAAIALPIAFAALTAWPLGADSSTRLGAALPLLVATSGLAALVVWKHRANIGRLRAGTEPRVGKPPSPPSATVRS